MSLLHRYDVKIIDGHSMCLSSSGVRFEVDMGLLIKRLAWQGYMRKGF